MTPADLALAAGAGVLAGGVNALAGGGTLISFPVLVALGLPPVSANITNTVALSPGYLGGALSQRSQLGDQRRRIRRLSIVAAFGGLAGSALLLITSDDVFRSLVPVLLLIATLLLALQDKLRTLLRIGTRIAVPRAGEREPSPRANAAHADPRWLVAPVFVVAVYGGFFGAGLGIMLLAVLGAVLHDSLIKLNALKQVLAFVINTTAALFFFTSGRVYWWFALVMAIGSLVGGHFGGRLAGAIKPEQLRTIVVVVGFIVTVVYAVKAWT